MLLRRSLPFARVRGRVSLLPVCIGSRQAARPDLRLFRHRHRATVCSGAEHHTGGARKEVRPDPPQVPWRRERDRDADRGITITAGSESAIVLTVDRGVWEHKTQLASIAQIKLAGPHREKASQVLLGCQLRPGPEASRFRHSPKSGLHVGCHVTVGKPGRIADQNIDAIGFAREPHRTREVANIVAPNVVPPFVMQAAHSPECPLDHHSVLRRNR